MIPVETYEKIIEVLPILCVDIVVRNAQGDFLLVKRTNEPKRGSWWVVGGRVLKGETLEEAATRKVREELDIDVSDLRPVGFFEAPCQKNPFGSEGPYHAVSVVFRTVIKGSQVISLDSQSSEWKFADALPSEFVIKPFFKV